MAVPLDQPAAPAGGSPSRSPLGGLVSAVRGPGFFMNSRRLWLLSVRLHRSGHPLLARWLKNFNSMLYHNSLPPQVRVSTDIKLGHQGFGTIMHPNVEIGHHVKIFHNVTIFVRPPTGRNKVVIEDGVVIGANAVILTPRGEDLRIGAGARVGAGAVVTHDVPPRMVAVSPPVQLRPRGSGRGPLDEADEDVDGD